ncbi:hypothetical protein [Pseudidiomarina donghaiensis]|uniref:hypothetical protein n=1 Tax=Pseudidiomarina donghaiensis TaxID=519452 RepID=UPI003A981807
MPNRARFVIHISLLLLITLFARPAFALSPSTAELPYALSAPELSREGYFVLTAQVQSSTAEQSLWVDYAGSAQFAHVSRSYPWLGQGVADFQQITLTGFTSGDHYFRLRNAAGDVLSNVVHVRVDHYPLWQALGLFFAGLTVFMVLVVLIIANHRAASRAKVSRSKGTEHE